MIGAYFVLLIINVVLINFRVLCSTIVQCNTIVTTKGMTKYGQNLFYHLMWLPLYVQKVPTANFN